MTSTKEPMRCPKMAFSHCDSAMGRAGHSTLVLFPPPDVASPSPLKVFVLEQQNHVKGYQIDILNNINTIQDFLLRGGKQLPPPVFEPEEKAETRDRGINTFHLPHTHSTTQTTTTAAFTKGFRTQVHVCAVMQCPDLSGIPWLSLPPTPCTTLSNPL